MLELLTLDDYTKLQAIAEQCFSDCYYMSIISESANLEKRALVDLLFLSESKSGKNKSKSFLLSFITDLLAAPANDKVMIEVFDKYIGYPQDNVSLDRVPDKSIVGLVRKVYRKTMRKPQTRKDRIFKQLKSIGDKLLSKEFLQGSFRLFAIVAVIVILVRLVFGPERIKKFLRFLKNTIQKAYNKLEDAIEWILSKILHSSDEDSTLSVAKEVL